MRVGKSDCEGYVVKVKEKRKDVSKDVGWVGVENGV